MRQKPRVLYFVTAHMRPKQVRRLIDALLAASPAGEVVLHFDPKGARIEPDAFPRDARFHRYPAPRPVLWGDFSLIDAFLDVSRWARSRLEFDWFIWISGQDYPLRPLDEFEAKLARSTADAYFRHFPVLDHPGWPTGEGFKRYYFRHYELPSLRYQHRLPSSVRDMIDATSRWFNAHQDLFVMRRRRLASPPRLGVRARRTPFDTHTPCIGGWSWLNLNTRCVDRIHEFVRNRPDFVEYYRRTQCPDESFLHTVLVNSPELVVANEPLRYVYWGERKFPSHPASITRGPQLEAAIASGMPFGRKFDIEVDASCLDELDRRIFVEEKRERSFT